MIELEYSLATRGDLPAMQALLAEGRLSAEALESHTDQCLVARQESRLVGMVALEPHGRAALLRSLAAAPGNRGCALGRGLCARMISHVRMLNVDRLYLLTTDAERYFAGLGFQRLGRNEAPAEIQATTQFRTLCPQSAVCMTRDICGEAIHASTELLRLRIPGAGSPPGFRNVARGGAGWGGDEK